MNAPIRVLLADDQTLVRQGIRSLLALADGLEVVGESSDGHETLDAIAAQRPDVVLLDLRMPGLDGIGVLRTLVDSAFQPPVLVLTTFDDDAAVLESLRLGAAGYLLKDVTLDDLVGAIRTVAGGVRLVQPAVTAGLLERMIGRGSAVAEPLPVAPELTARELDVLRLMAGGYANREIAAALHLAEGTVKNYASAVLLKLGVRDRTRAVLRGLELGLIGATGVGAE